VKKHTIEVVVDRIVVENGTWCGLIDTFEAALRLSNGLLWQLLLMRMKFFSVSIILFRFVDFQRGRWRQDGFLFIQ
jgi:excinuclease UvrABC ATPase subunit